MLPPWPPAARQQGTGDRKFGWPVAAPGIAAGSLLLSHPLPLASPEGRGCGWIARPARCGRNLFIPASGALAPTSIPNCAALDIISVLEPGHVGRHHPELLTNFRNAIVIAALDLNSVLSSTPSKEGPGKKNQSAQWRPHPLYQRRCPLQQCQVMPVLTRFGATNMSTSHPRLSRLTLPRRWPAGYETSCRGVHRIN